MKKTSFGLKIQTYPNNNFSFEKCRPKFVFLSEQYPQYPHTIIDSTDQRGMTNLQHNGISH